MTATMTATASTTAVANPRRFLCVTEREGVHYLTGTHVPVALVVHLVKDLGCSLMSLPGQYEGMTERKVDEALAWAVANPALIDRERCWLLGRKAG